MAKNNDNELEKLKKELAKKEVQLKQLSELTAKDPLTGLFNRRAFLDAVEKIYDDIQYAKRAKDDELHRHHFYIHSLSILFIDIDNFKKINDTYGHDIGDKILKRVVSIIENKVRTSDFASRWGGEEIVAALLGASEEDAFKKAEEIRKTVKNKIKIPGRPEFVITLSIGVAEIDGTATLEDLVKRADEAMYRAKTTGKNKTIKYSVIKAM